jgi:hypothetical protein
MILIIIDNEYSEALIINNNNDSEALIINIIRIIIIIN